MSERTVSVVYRAVIDQYQRNLLAARADTKALGDEWERTTKRQSDSLKQTGDQMISFGGAMTRSVTLPLAAAGALAVKTALDWESAWAGVTKTVDGTDEQMAALQQGIIDMSAELPASRTQIAAVAEAAGQLGIKTENILGFTRTMIDLGETTNLSADQAATALARFANITQMPQDQFDRLGSVIVDLGNNMATTEAEIVEFATRLAGAGTQVGLSEGEILAFGAAMSSLGIEAEAGGTAMSKLWKDIEVAVETGSDDLTQFADVAGMSVGEFSTLFQDDAAGAVEAFILGLGGMEEQGQSAIAVLSEMGITEARMSNAILALASSGDLLTESLAMQGDAWEENNALSDEAQKRYETTAAQLKMAWNQITEAFLIAGEAIMPVVTGIADMAVILANAFSAIPAPAQTAVIVMLGMAAAAGPISSALGYLVKNVDTIARVLPTVTSKAQTMWSALDSGTGALGRTSSALKGIGTAASGAAVAWFAYDQAVSAWQRQGSEWAGTALEGLDEQINSGTLTMAEFVAQQEVLARSIGGVNEAVEGSEAPWDVDKLVQMDAGHQEMIRFADGMHEVGQAAKDLAADAGISEDAALQFITTQRAAGVEFESTEAALRAYNEQQLLAAGLTPDAAEETAGLGQEFVDVEARIAAAREELEEWENTIRAQWDPLFALSDALVGVEDAQIRVAEAEAEIQRLNAEGAGNDPLGRLALAEATRELEQAQWDLLGVNVDLDSAARNLATSIQTGDTSLEAAKATIDNWTASGRISADQAAILKTKLDELVFAGLLVDSVDPQMTVTAPGLEAARVGLQNLWDMINNIQGAGVEVDLAGILGASTAQYALDQARGHAHGGSTSAGAVYEVAEQGPELFTDPSGRTYLMAATSGFVTPMTSFSAGGGRAAAPPIDYDRLGRAVAKAMTGTSIDVDGQRFGELVTEELRSSSRSGN